MKRRTKNKTVAARLTKEEIDNLKSLNENISKALRFMLNKYKKDNPVRQITVYNTNNNVILDCIINNGSNNATNNK